MYRWNEHIKLWGLRNEKTWEAWLRNTEEREIREMRIDLRNREGAAYGERPQPTNVSQGRRLEIQQRRMLDRARPIPRGGANTNAGESASSSSSSGAAARDRAKANGRDISRNF